MPRMALFAHSWTAASTATAHPVPSVTMSVEEQTDLKALTKTLSESYSSLAHHQQLPPSTVLHHLAHLAQYSHHLPLSWFTPSFTQICFDMHTQFQQLPSPEWQGIESLCSLWTVWLRRLSNAPHALPPVQLQVTHVLASMRTLLLSIPSSPSSLQQKVWVGLVGLAGSEAFVTQDVWLLDTMTQALAYWKKEGKVDGATVEAGVAHGLAQTSALNSFEVESCQQLVEAYVQYAARSIEQHLRSVVHVMEHCIDKRASQQPISRAEANLETLVEIAKAIVETSSATVEEHMARLAVIAGVARTLQFVSINTSKINTLKKESQAIMADTFNRVVIRTESLEQNPMSSMYQDTMAYFSGQCLPTLSLKMLTAMDLKATLQCITSCLLTSDSIWGAKDMICHLSNDPKDTLPLTQLLQHPLHKDIGRISRATAKVIHASLESKDSECIRAVRLLLEGLTELSRAMSTAWETFIVNHGKEGQPLEKTLDTAIWTLFKTLLFSCTAIVKQVTTDPPKGEGFLLIPEAAPMTVSLYANLHFITEHLGTSEGFQAYQDVLKSTVAFLTYKDNVPEFNCLFNTAYMPYVPASPGTGTGTGTGTQQPMSMSRPSTCYLLFFTDLAEQTMKVVDDDVLENALLPCIYSLLKQTSPIPKKLYESAHTAMLSVMAAHKPIAREVASVYAQLLIHSYPEHINLQQLRLGYTTMIHSLCEMDDAVAWLTVGLLLQKMDSWTQEVHAVQRSEYLSVLFDLLKPLSLGPFFAEYLNKMEGYVLAQETQGMKEATLKLLFETVSGTAQA
ncbi:hypothetical protein BDF14DRAFT_51846 [Spinellus fusiger]|nr:hypothetical protein BDF14DRAFT_51846 [Spinellus fusiger]